jgi:DNA-binding protein H-NS
MPGYIQLKNQIQKLQAEAEILRKRERGEVIANIKEAIAAFELTSEDLGLTVSTRGFRARKVGEKKAGEGISSVKKYHGPPYEKTTLTGPLARRSDNKSRAADKRSVVAPKYRDPATGTTWTGRGKQPKWLAAAINGGKKLEDFKI